MSSEFISRLKNDDKLIPKELTKAFVAKDYKKSILLCNRLLKKHPRNAVALLQRGIAMYELEKYNDALSSYLIILEDLPQFWYVWRCVGRCSMQLKEFTKARGYFSTALKLGGSAGGNTEDLCSIALCYFQEGKYAEAHYMLDVGYEHADNKMLILFTKGLLEEKSGNTNQAFFSYLQSQMLADGEDKEIGGRKIVELLRK